MTGGTEPVVVGYDGRAYIAGLQKYNEVTLNLETGACTARFDYQPGGESQSFIEGVTCK